MTVHFTINGYSVSLDVPPLLPLVSVLRDRLDLRGTKVGCGNGECGACTVVIDGRAMCSCILPVHRVDGSEVQTIEGLAASGALTALQSAFVAAGATQCGFCTSGMIMSAFTLLHHKPILSRGDVVAGLAGNICRCTGYHQIIEAVLSVAGAKPDVRAE